MTVTMEKIVSLAKRRGFVYPGSEIYGGFANSWDYGPYGTLLKKNIQEHWWRTFVQKREDIVGLDSSIIMNPKIWESSGHIASFSDPLIDCKNCKERIRGDKLIEEHLGIETAVGKTLKEISEIIKTHKLKCPRCGKADFTEARSFNLMFKTHQGVVEEHSTAVYMRPETAQGIFVNFKNIVLSTRVKVPFGIAQIGKAFRNEITPGNFTFRTREFEQMEIEYFIAPHDKSAIKEKFEEWKDLSRQWFTSIGIKEDKLRYREHEADELSHYSSMTFDIEYNFPFGWGELMGVAYRGCYDLTQHETHSGNDLHYTDPHTNEKYLPHVIEPAFGLSRTTLVALLDAYDEDTIDGETRTVLRFSPAIAPIKAAVFPLIKKDPLVHEARRITELLQNEYQIEYDESGSIGKRYRRQDEIGTPYGITIDFETLEDHAVTIRSRDTATQERIKTDHLPAYLKDHLSNL